MNALIFLVPEDIVDVRPRLVRISFLSASYFTSPNGNTFLQILTFVGSLMSLSKH